jgi:hypothetical protein
MAGSIASLAWFKERAGFVTLLLVFFLLLGIADTYPVARYFSGGVPYTRHSEGEPSVTTNVHGDHLQLYYRFWLFLDSMRGNADFYTNKYEFQTGGGEVFPVRLYFLPFPLVFALFHLFGLGAGYNAALLAAYVLSGLGMYLLVHHYTGDRMAALAAGAIFAASPYRSAAAMGGHPAGFSMFLVPLFLYALEKILSTKSLKFAFLGGMAFWLLTDNDLHVIYLTALVTPLFVVKHFAAAGWRRFPGEARELLVPAGLSLAVAVPALFYPSPTVSAGLRKSRSLGEIKAYSPDLSHAFLRNNVELTTTVYLGIAALLFAAVVFGLSLLRRRSSGRERGLRWRMGFFLALLAGTYVLAFGPNFPFSKPYTFLYHHLPKFGQIRQTAKFMILSSFALSVAAGLGFAYLRSLFPGRRTAALLLGLLAVLLVEQSPLFGKSAGISLLPQEVKAYEAAFRGNPEAKVINVPLWPGNDAWSSHYQYYTTLYRTLMVNGYGAVAPREYFKEVFLPLFALNAGQMGNSQYALLRKMGIEYLNLHEESFPQKVCIFPPQYALENLLRSPFLELVSSAPPVSTFRILEMAEPPAEGVEFSSSVTAVVIQGRKLRGGEVVSDAGTSSGKALRLGEEEKSRTVISRRTTPAGDYVLTLRVRTEGTATFKLSVFAYADKARIASETFDLDTAGEWRMVSLDFSLPEAMRIISQVDKPEGSSLLLDWSYLRFADQQDPLPAFEFEEIYHFGNVQPRAGASGGRAVRLTASDPVGQVTRGPYRLYDAGDYTLSVALALGEGEEPEGKETVAALTLLNDNDRMTVEGTAVRGVILGERRITAAEFTDRKGFNVFSYPFALDRPTILSVHVTHFGRTLDLDRVIVAKVED